MDRESLILSCTGMVRHLASRYARRFDGLFDVADLSSVGNIGLIEAVDEFDPSLGSLPTFAWRKVRDAIVAHIRTEPRVCVQFADELPDTPDGRCPDPVGTASFNVSFDELTHSFSDRQKRLVHLVLIDGHSIAAASRKVGIKVRSGRSLVSMVTS